METMEEREQESATIRTSKVDLLRSASKATKQTNSTCHEHISGPAKPRGPSGRSCTAMEQTAGQLRSSLTLP